MGKKVADIFGITDKHIESLKKNYPIGFAEFQGAVLAVSKYTAQFGTREAVTALLRRTASKPAAKSLSRYVPIIGQIISAGLAYKMTLSYGEETRAAAYEAASNILVGIVLKETGPAGGRPD